MEVLYPKVSNAAVLASYEDFKTMHRAFLEAYKKLHDDVAVFSLLPENFIREAEPVIERSLDEFSDKAGPENKMRLEVMTDFISRFYEFMDEATEMFTTHQAFSNQTLQYLEQVSELNANRRGKTIEASEEDFIALIPQLEELTVRLVRVREKVDHTSEELNMLKPLWEKIKPGF